MKRDRQFRWRGLIGGLILFPLTVAVLFSQPLIIEGSWTDSLMDILAYAAFTIGAIFRLWSTVYIGGRKEKQVTCEGPYSICRNPLYVGSLFLAVSAGLFFTSIVFAVGIGVTILFYMLATIPSEEKFLGNIFGETYTEYCRKVPRFVPRFSLYHTAPTIQVNVKALRGEFRRALIWIWIPVLGELIAQLRSQDWWPHLFRLL
ncbi:MAG: isoprenylcysteine carboxylmethyltransferase family protein [Verrucomicrobiota bacterium]